VTIAVVWPLVGFLCVALQGGPGELLDLVARAVRRVVHGARSQRKV